MQMRSTILAFAAAAAALATTFAATGAAAAVSGDQVEIAYRDLNLGSEAGREALDRRIAYAARQLCGDYLITELKFRALSESCQADIVASAQAQRAAAIGGRSFAMVVSRRAAS